MFSEWVVSRKRSAHTQSILRWITVPGFEIQATCPRTGARWDTAHGDVETPVFMPGGTQATVKGLLPRALSNDLDAKHPGLDNFLQQVSRRNLPISIDKTKHVSLDLRGFVLLPKNDQRHLLLRLKQFGFSAAFAG